MSTCCDPSGDKPESIRPGTLSAALPAAIPGQGSSPTGNLTIALAGNPNSGKTTLFNALTGLRQKVANYPGVTVEKKTGRCKLPDGRLAAVIDLPGTYSLISRSPDEQVAMEVLRGMRADTPPPDVVIAVIDASNLQRNLYLVSQLVELGRPMVIALNMMDIAERRGLHVDPAGLSRELGVPVVPLIGHKRNGVDKLKAALAHARVAPLPDWQLPPAMNDELLVVGGGLAILDSRGDSSNASAREDSTGKTETLPPFGKAVEPRAWICRDDSVRRLDRYQAIAERLLIGDCASDMAEVARQEPVASLLRSSNGRLSSLGIDPMQADIEAHYRWIESIAKRSIAGVEDLAAMGAPAPPEALEYESPKMRTWSERADAILVHRLWGLLAFSLIMGTLFVSIFWLAQPIMNGIQNGSDWLADLTSSQISNPALKDLVKSGVFGGVGTVVSFIPQIALLFMFLAILEDSGYLARAAFLMDRLLAKVGLHGKSFIPLLSSFACAIPGIMAARTIENRRDRLATILIAPFMSCSARLPVYTLLIGTFFAGRGAFAQAGIMLACYALGIIAAAGTAWVFRRSFLKGAASTFILELPTYKLPQLSQVLRQMWSNSRAFITKAGTTIFCFSVVLWALAFFPRLPENQVQQIRQQAVANAALAPAPDTSAAVSPVTPADQPAGQASAAQTSMAEAPPTAKEIEDRNNDIADHAEQAAKSSYSLAGRMGHAMEPLIRPLGFDWKMGVGLVGAFAAREVFVSTMGIIYSVGEVKDDKTDDLANAMRDDHYSSGRPVWTPLVAVSLLIWFVLALQCMSTVVIVRRETGGWTWPIFMIVYMNALAYVVCLVVYQVGHHVFHA